MPRAPRDLLVVITAALLVPASTLVAQVQQNTELAAPLSLARVVQLARTQRSEIVAARERTLAAEQRPRIVSALEDPMISPSVDHWPFGAPMADVSLVVEQRFPLSGVLGHRRRSAEADARRLHLEVRRTTLDVELDAALAFLMLYERRQLLGILEEQHRLATQLVVASSARYRAGIGAQADVIRAEVEVARIAADLAATRARIISAEAMLNTAIGRAAGLSVPQLNYAAVETPPPAAAETVKAALTRRPELRGAEAEIGRAEAEIDVMRSMYLPMAMVRTGPAYTMADGAGAMLMVGVSLPLWRGRLDAGVQEAEAMARMARADLDAMKRMAEGEAAGARAEVDAARIRFLSIRDDVLPRARHVIEPTISAYASGQVPLVSVVEALRVLWSTRAELVSAEANLGAAWARLGRATGDLEGVLGVLEE